MKENTINQPGKCVHCGGDMAYKHHHHVERVGPYKINDDTGFANACAKCGAVEMSLNDQEGYELRAAALVLLEGYVNGPVVRYARHAMGLTQKELGLVLDYVPETISLWENGKDVMPRSVQLALRDIVLATLYGTTSAELVTSAERRKAEGPPSKGEMNVAPMRRVC